MIWWGIEMEANWVLKQSMRESNFDSIQHASQRDLLMKQTCQKSWKLVNVNLVILQVKVKKVEFKKLKTTFVGIASEFIKRYLTNLVDYMTRDEHQLSTRRDHYNKCSAYTELVPHLKELDKNCLGPLRKAYCTSFNLLLRRESREFANELRTSSQVSRNPISWFDAYAGSAQTKRNTDTSEVSDAYAKMLTNFIPHLEQESLCALILKLRKLTTLEDFYSIIEWGNKIDPSRCVSMNGITVQSLSAQRPIATKFVVALLTDLQSRLKNWFTFYSGNASSSGNQTATSIYIYIPDKKNSLSSASISSSHPRMLLQSSITNSNGLKPSIAFWRKHTESSTSLENLLCWF